MENKTVRDKTKRSKNHYFRHPRTTQERRENHKHNKWCRRRRNKANLTNAYDDIKENIQKSWKVKRRHQYREQGRGRQHELFLPANNIPNWAFWLSMYDVKQYFNNHDIPFRVKRRCEVTYKITRYRWNSRFSGYKTHYDEDGNSYDYPVFKDVCIKLEKPIIRKYSTLLGYEVTWWSNKDIGIEHILQSSIQPYFCY